MTCIKPRVLNKKHDGIPAGALYVGRPSDWGNPFAMTCEAGRMTVVSRYYSWLIEQPQLLSRLHELKGHDLVC